MGMLRPFVAYLNLLGQSMQWLYRFLILHIVLASTDLV